jgi:exodeoxyribonuclease VII small subunit
MPDQSDQSSNSCQPLSFEGGLARLGEIVARLESGSLGLSASITTYEEGVAILRQLHEELAVVEERVRVLVRIDDEGRPVLEPLATVEADEAARLPGRKTSARAEAGRKRTKTLPGMDDETGDA